MDVDYKARTGLNSRQQYEEMYKESISRPARFWAKQAEGLAWRKKVCDSMFRIFAASGTSAAPRCSPFVWHERQVQLCCCWHAEASAKSHYNAHMLPCRVDRTMLRGTLIGNRARSARTGSKAGRPTCPTTAWTGQQPPLKAATTCPMEPADPEAQVSGQAAL